MYFVVLADPKVKIKDNEKREKYLDFAMTVIQSVIGARGTIIKGLIRGLEELDIGG